MDKVLVYPKDITEHVVECQELMARVVSVVVCCCVTTKCIFKTPWNCIWLEVSDNKPLSLSNSLSLSLPLSLSHSQVEEEGR